MKNPNELHDIATAARNRISKEIAEEKERKEAEEKRIVVAKAQSILNNLEKLVEQLAAKGQFSAVVMKITEAMTSERASSFSGGFGHPHLIHDPVAICVNNWCLNAGFKVTLNADKVGNREDGYDNIWNMTIHW